MKTYNLTLDNGIIVTMTLNDAITDIATEIPKYVSHLPSLNKGLTQGNPPAWPSPATQVTSYSEVT